MSQQSQQDIAEIASTELEPNVVEIIGAMALTQADMIRRLKFLNLYNLGWIRLACAERGIGPNLPFYVNENHGLGDENFEDRFILSEWLIDDVYPAVSMPFETLYSYGLDHKSEHIFQSKTRVFRDLVVDMIRILFGNHIDWLESIYDIPRAWKDILQTFELDSTDDITVENLDEKKKEAFEFAKANVAYVLSRSRPDVCYEIFEMIDKCNEGDAILEENDNSWDINNLDEKIEAAQNYLNGRQVRRKVTTKFRLD